MTYRLTYTLKLKQICSMAHSVPLWLKTQRYLVRITAGSNIWVVHIQYLKTVKSPGVCSAVYGTMHYKKT